MASQFVLIDREALSQVLQRSFDAATVQTLLEALDQVAGQVHAASASRDEFMDFEAFLSGLAEAHRATEKSLRDLAETQQRGEERMDGLRAYVNGMSEAQSRADQRMEALAAAQSRVDQVLGELAEAQKRTEQQVRELAEAQKRTEQQVGELVETMQRFETRMQRFETRMQRFEDKLGKVVGRTLELEYRDKAAAYFGRWLRRPRIVSISDLWDDLETRLTEEDFDEVRVLDLIVTGRPRIRPEVGDIWLAVEVSAAVDTGDTERAVRRARLLQRAGYAAIPVVAGDVLAPEADQEAHRRSVAVLHDGSASYWEEALAAWLPSLAG